MKTRTIPQDTQHLSPADAEIRLLMDSPSASLVHCTLKQDQVFKKGSKRFQAHTVRQLVFF